MYPHSIFHLSFQYQIAQPYVSWEGLILYSPTFKSSNSKYEAQIFQYNPFSDFKTQIAHNL